MLTTRKLLSLIIALVILLTAAIVPAGAIVKQTAPTVANDVIYFDANSVSSGKFTRLFFYIMKDGEEIYPWSSKKTRGTDDNEDGIWEYDLSDHGITLQEGSQYLIIFYGYIESEGFERSDEFQTVMLVLDSSCLGDPAYVTGKTHRVYERNNSEVKWRNSSCKMALALDDYGNVFGETCPNYTTPYEILTDFLGGYFYSDLGGHLTRIRNYDWAVENSGKSSQALLDDIGSGLGLTANDVERAVEEADLITDWRFENSTLPTDPNASPYSASGPAEGADIAPAIPDDMIYFDANSAGWKNVKNVKFYIYDSGKLVNAAFLNGTDKNGDNIWEYALSDYGYDTDWNTKYDLIIENADTGERTYDLYFISPVFHDIACCTGDRAILDSQGAKNRLVAQWKKHGKDYTPSWINLEGRLIGGEYYDRSTHEIVMQYLTSPDGLAAVIARTGLSAQELIDRLGVEGHMDVIGRYEMSGLLDEAAAAGVDWRSQWNFEASTLPDLSSGHSSSGSGSGWFTKPDSDIHVILEPISVPDAQELPAPRYKTIRGNSGNYKFYNLLPGTYKLTIKKRFNATREYVIIVGKGSSLDIKQDAATCPVGDASGDKQITTLDFGKANSHARGKSKLEGYALTCADVTGDGAVTTADAGKINSHARGKSSLWK